MNRQTWFNKSPETTPEVDAFIAYIRAEAGAEHLSDEALRLIVGHVWEVRESDPDYDPDEAEPVTADNALLAANVDALWFEICSVEIRNLLPELEELEDDELLNELSADEVCAGEYIDDAGATWIVISPSDGFLSEIGRSLLRMVHKRTH